MLARAPGRVNALTRLLAGRYTAAIVPTAAHPRTGTPRTGSLPSRTITRTRSTRAVLAALCAGTLVALGASSCSERSKPAPLGLGTVEPDRSDETVRTIFASPPAIDTFSETVVGAGESATLYAGSFGTREMRSLVRFSGLPSGRTVTGATLRLTVTGAAGDSTSETVLARRLRADWTESTTNAESLPAFDAEPVGQAASSPGVTPLDVGLPASLVQAWIDSSAANFGLLLGGMEPALLRKFASSEADSGRPLLIVVSLLDGASRADSVLADRDTYVTSPDTSIDRGAASRLLIGKESGFARRAAFEFTLPADLDSFATVNFASIELTLDANAARLRSGGTTISVQAHEVISPVDSSAIIFRTEPEGIRAVDAAAETLSIAVTALVGRQHIARDRRVKILVKATTESADTDMISAFSSEGASAAADSLARPRLRLIVSSPTAPGAKR